MAVSAPAQGNAEAAKTFADAHRELVADTAIQFALPAFEPPKTPAWLEALANLLAALGPVMPFIFWGALALGILFLLYLIVPRLTGFEWPWRRKATTIEDDWRPEESAARQLLAEAEALAAQGNYSEAAHLLLFRSIEDIDRRRPKLVRPALTSRDIASDEAIPERPKSAFATIVAYVESSLFGGRALGSAEWQDCRANYEQFAFAEGWR